MALLHVKQVFTGMVSGTPAWHDVYTVPAGDRFVLRELDLQNFNSTTQTVYLGVNRGQYAQFTVGPGDAGVIRVQRWIVLEPGDKVSIFNGATAGFYAVVSGSIYTI